LLLNKERKETPQKNNISPAVSDKTMFVV